VRRDGITTKVNRIDEEQSENSVSSILPLLQFQPSGTATSSSPRPSTPPGPRVLTHTYHVLDSSPIPTCWYRRVLYRCTARELRERKAKGGTRGTLREGVECREGDERTDEEIESQRRFQRRSTDVRCSNCVLAVYRNSDYDGVSARYLPPAATYLPSLLALSTATPTATRQSTHSCMRCKAIDSKRAKKEHKDPKR
jgi:hypothetical protein